MLLGMRSSTLAPLVLGGVVVALVALTRRKPAPATPVPGQPVGLPADPLGARAAELLQLAQTTPADSIATEQIVQQMYDAINALQDADRVHEANLLANAADDFRARYIGQLLARSNGLIAAFDQAPAGGLPEDRVEEMRRLARELRYAGDRDALAVALESRIRQHETVKARPASTASDVLASYDRWARSQGTNEEKQQLYLSYAATYRAVFGTEPPPGPPPILGSAL